MSCEKYILDNFEDGNGFNKCESVFEEISKYERNFVIGHWMTGVIHSKNAFHRNDYTHVLSTLSNLKFFIV